MEKQHDGMTKLSFMAPGGRRSDQMLAVMQAAKRFGHSSSKVEEVAAADPVPGEDVVGTLIQNVARTLFDIEAAGSLKRSVQMDDVHRFIDGEEDIISFVVTEDMDTGHDEPTGRHVASQLPYSMNRSSNRCARSIDRSGKYEGRHRVAQAMSWNRSMRGQQSHLTSLEDKSRAGPVPLTPGSSVSSRAAAMNSIKADEVLAKMQKPAPPAPVVDRHLPVVVLRGIPQQNDEYFQVCYLMKVGRVTSADEVMMGLFVNEKPLEYCASLLQCLNSKEASLSLMALASAESRMLKLPQQKPDTLLTPESMASFVESWGDLLERVVSQSIPSDDFHNNADSLTEGPRYEIELWMTCKPMISAVLDHTHQSGLQRALECCDDHPVAAAYRHAEHTARGTIKEADGMARTLASLHHLFSPLYCDDFRQVVTSLPLICHTIMYLKQLSPHYSRTSNLTRLLKRVTVQLITHLKSIIGAECGGDVLWSITASADGVDSMLTWCEQVHAMAKEFRAAITQACNDYKVHVDVFFVVAGRLELFCKRVAKLAELFTYMKRYNLLAMRQLPGTEQCVVRFKRLLQQLRFSGIDVFEYTTPAFDRAFITMRESLEELDASLRIMIKNAFEKVTDVNQSYMLLKTFSSALSPSVVGKKHLIILERFASEMLRLHSYFERYKGKPPGHRNALPLVSAVGWSRLLSKKLTEKAQILSKKTPESSGRVFSRAVAAYNTAASAVVRYESTCLASCKSYFTTGLSGLRSPPILVWTDEGLEAFIDHQGLVSLNVAKQLQRLGVDLPYEVRTTLDLVPFTNKNLALLQCLTDRYTTVLQNLPSYLRPVAAPLIAHVNEALRPGLEGPISWMSVGITQFIETVEGVVKNLIESMSHIKVIADDWLGHALLTVSDALYLDLSKAPYTLDEFATAQKRHLRKQPQLVKRCSIAVERGCLTLLEFLPEVSYSSRQKLLRHFYRQLTKELIGVTVRSLEALRNAVSHRLIAQTFLNFKATPFLKVCLYLGSSGVEVDPKPSEIYDTITKVGAGMMDVTRGLEPWQSYPEEAVSEEISRSKEVIKKLFLLSGSASDLEAQLRRQMERFGKYEPLWTKSKEVTARQFGELSPTLEQYELEVARYREMLHDLRELPDAITAPPFLIDITSLRSSLADSITQWILSFQKPVHVLARASLEDLKSRLDGLEAKLTADAPATLPVLASLVQTLSEMRDFSSEIDQIFHPMRNRYDFLIQGGYAVPEAERNYVSDLKYRWQKMMGLADTMNDYVQKIQWFIRRDLIHDMERFRVEVTVFANKFRGFKVTLDTLQALDALERLRKNEVVVKDMVKRCFEHHAGAQLFSIPFTRHPLLEQCEREFKQLMQMYVLRNRVGEEEHRIKQMFWADVNLVLVSASVQLLSAEFKALPTSLSERTVYGGLSDILGNLRSHIPLLKMLSEPCIQARHWQRLMAICEHQWSIKPDVFRVKDVLSANLAHKREAIEELVLCASKEAHIEKSLSQVAEMWETRQFLFVPRFKGWGDILDASDVYAVKDALEESQLMLTALLSSRYINFFKEETERWMQTLATTAEMMAKWMEVQTAWLHIEGVFSGDRIARQMPDEVRRFAIIDQQWCKIINRAKQSTNVISFCTGNDLAVLPSLANHLSECQLKLHVYLEEKRECFPRLYFVSERMLLQILASPDASFLPSVFYGVTEGVVQEQDGGGVILTGLVSAGDRPLTLMKPVVCDGNVEQWLCELRQETHSTMRDVVRQAAVELHHIMGADNVDVNFFLAPRPLQVNQLMIHLLWTGETSAMLSTNRGEGRRHEGRRSKVGYLAASLVKAISNVPRETIQSFQAVTCTALYFSEVAQRIQQVVKRKDADPNTVLWDWMRLLRVYWKGEGEQCSVRCVDADLPYGFDYLGFREKLVITPLTERCFVTLFQAMMLHLCGALVGPSSVGKTDTIKDLGSICGRTVIVFNCSQTMASSCVGSILRGLVQSGDWGMFDDFPRIPAAVLSTMASQITCVFTALKKRITNFIFTDGLPCKVNHNMGCFMTMQGHYTSVVPDNLKTLFRTASMIVPDRFLITRAKLVTLGFKDYSGLARKVDQLFRLLECKFGNDYDLGLRTLAPVFDFVAAPPDPTAQRQRGSFFCATTSAVMQLGEAELVNALDRTLRPKLKAEDANELTSLMGMIFVAEPSEADPDSTDTLCVIARSMGLRHPPDFIHKADELHVVQRTRHGILVTGAADSGKSSVIKVVLQGLTENENLKHKAVRLHPRALTCEEMYGCLDSATGKWLEGVFSSLFNKANNEARGTQCTWVICDGPVQQDWVENLTTVLDSTKVLSLSNGDRIQMAPTTRLVFESLHIQDVTPSMISRLGLVHLRGNEVNIEDRIDAYIRDVESMGEFEGLAGELCDLIRQHFYLHAYPMFTICKSEIEKRFGEFDPRSTIIHCLQAACQMLQQLRRVTDASDCCERVCWSLLSTLLGSLCGKRGRIQLDNYIRHKATRGSLPPKRSVIYNYTISPVTGEWMPLSPTIVPVDGICSAYMPTLQTEHVIKHAEVCLRAKIPVLITGGRCCGKTTLLQAALRSVEDVASWQRVKLWNSTTAPKLRSAVETYFMKKMGNTFCPRNGGSLYLMFDDLHLPAQRSSDATEFIRQIVESQGYWGAWNTTEWRALADLACVATLDTSHPVRASARLLRHFVMLECESPTPDEVHYIVSNVIPSMQDRIKHMTVDIWLKCRRTLLPSPSRPHLIWSMVKIWRVLHGTALAPHKFKGNKPGQLAVWKNEVLREFGDPLPQERDRAWLKAAVATMLQHDRLPDEGHVVHYYVKHESVIKEMAGESARPKSSMTNRKATRMMSSVLLRKVSLHNRVAGLRDMMNGLQIKNYGFKGASLVYDHVPHAELTRTLRKAHGLLKEGKGELSDIVLIPDMIFHVARVARVLSTPRGSMLLVSQPGYGRRSLVRLAAHVCGQSFHDLTNPQGGANEALERLKHAVKASGITGPQCAFVKDDFPFSMEIILEKLRHLADFNDLSLLLSQEIGAINQILLSPVTGGCNTQTNDTPTESPASHKCNYAPVPDRQPVLSQTFLKRVQDNFHFVLCLSPATIRHRTFVRDYSVFFTQCIVDWYVPWSKRSVAAVVSGLISSSPLTERGHALFAKKIGQTAASLHAAAVALAKDYMQEGRQVRFDIRDLQKFVQIFITTFQKKKKEMCLYVAKARVGLHRLRETSDDIQKLQALAANKEELLKESQQKQALLRAETYEISQEVQNKRRKVDAAKVDLAAKAGKVSEARHSVQADLECIKPAFEGAKRALECIAPADLKNIRAMSNPPYAVRRVFEPLLMLLHQPLAEVRVDEAKSRTFQLQDSWHSSGKALCRADFMQNIAEFTSVRKDYINDETVEFMWAIMPEEDFSFERVRKSSGNLGAILTWARVVSDYCTLRKTTEHLLVAVRHAEGKARASNVKLQKAQESFEATNQEARRIARQLDDLKRLQGQCEEEAGKIRMSSEAAVSFVGGLISLRQRWTHAVNTFDEMITQLPFNILAFAFATIYAGPFNETYRAKLFEIVNRICGATDTRKPLEAFFSRDTATVSQNPLLSPVLSPSMSSIPLMSGPLDQFYQTSLNIIYSVLPHRFSFLIDPQRRGLQLIKDCGYSKNINCFSAAEGYFVENLIDSMKAGVPVVLENCSGNIHADIWDLLRKNFVRNGRTVGVTVKGRHCEVSDGFELFLCCKEPDAVIHPQLEKLVSVVDFRASSLGFEQHFLNHALKEMKSDTTVELAGVRYALQTEEAKVQGHEAHILDSLATTTTAIVEDDDLLTHLFEVRHLVQEQQTKITKWQGICTKIEAAVLELQPVAVRGSSLFAVATLMSRVSPVYATSLAQFLHLFTTSIKSTDTLTVEQTGRRISNILLKLTQLVHTHFSRMVLEEHRAFFSLFFALHIATENGAVPPDGLQALISLGNSEHRPHHRDMAYAEDDKEYAALLDSCNFTPDAVSKRGLYSRAYLLTNSYADDQEDCFALEEEDEAPAHNVQREIDMLESPVEAARRQTATKHLGTESPWQTQQDADDDNSLLRDFTATASFIVDSSEIDAFRSQTFQHANEEPGSPGFGGDKIEVRPAHDGDVIGLSLDPLGDLVGSGPVVRVSPSADGAQPPEPSVEAPELPPHQGLVHSQSAGDLMEGVSRAAVKPQVVAPADDVPVITTTVVPKQPSVKKDPGGPRRPKPKAASKKKKRHDDEQTRRPSIFDGFASVGGGDPWNDDSADADPSGSPTNEQRFADFDSAPDTKMGVCDELYEGQLGMSVRSQRLERFFSTRGGDEDEDKLCSMGEGFSRMSRDAELALYEDGKEFFDDDVVIKAMSLHGCFQDLQDAERPDDLEGTDETAPTVKAHATRDKGKGHDADQAQGSAPEFLVEISKPGVDTDTEHTPVHERRVEIRSPSIRVKKKHAAVQEAAQSVPAVMECDIEQLGSGDESDDGSPRRKRAADTEDVKLEHDDELGATLPSWVPLAVRLNLKLAVKAYQGFAVVPRLIEERKDTWKDWFEHEAPEMLPMPGGIAVTATGHFDKLLMLRCFRPDRILQSAQLFINTTLGEDYSEPTEVSFLDAIEGATISTPVLWLISPGVDPTGEIDALSKRVKQKLSVLTIGEDEERRQEDGQTEVHDRSSAHASSVHHSFVSKSVSRSIRVSSTRTTICAQDPSAMEMDQEAGVNDEDTDNVAEWGVIENELESGSWVLLQNIHFSRPIVQKLRQYLEARHAETEREREVQMQESLKHVRENHSNTLSNTMRNSDMWNTHAIRSHEKKPKAAPDAVPPPAKVQSHESSRLLLTADLSAVDGIPLYLLENCHKICSNRPPGVRRSMKQAVDSLSSEFVTTFKRPEFKTLVYAVCLIHCLLRNRGRYKPNGWGSDYIYQLSDIPAVTAFLHHHFSLLGDTGPRCKPVDFTCIDYMIGSIFYTGDVAEETDRSTILSQISWYFRGLMETPVSDRSDIEVAPGGYVVQWGMNLQDFQTFISAIPPVDTAAAFGLHNAVDGVVTSQSFLNTVATAMAKPVVLRPVHRVCQILEILLWKFNGMCPLSASRRRGPHNPPSLCMTPLYDSPLDRFLQAEIQMFDAMIRRVRQQIKNVLSGIHGIRNLCEGEFDILEDLQAGRLPRFWPQVDKHDFGGSLWKWGAHLHQQHSQLNTWEETGLPRVVWLGGLANPRGLLAAFLQQAAETDGRMLMSLGTEVTVSKSYFDTEIEPGPRVLYLRGVALEGALWDSEHRTLTTQVSAVHSRTIPLVCVSVVDLTQPTEQQTQRVHKNRKGSENDLAELGGDAKVELPPNVSEIPCFSCRSRGDANLITNVRVELSNKHYWRAKGVAFFAD